MELKIKNMTKAQQKKAFKLCLESGSVDTFNGFLKQFHNAIFNENGELIES